MSYLNTPETLIRFCQSNDLKLLKIQRMPIISVIRYIWVQMNMKSFPLTMTVLYFTMFNFHYSKRRWTEQSSTARYGKNPMNDHLKVKELPPEEKTDEAPAFDIGMGYLGNGLTVWNRAVEENGDYQTIAHISNEGEIHYYVDGLPEDVVARIEQAAAQEQQKKSLFAASYQVGDRVYLDGKPFEITRVDDWNVELMDRSEQNPQPRLESKDNFMQLVQQNERSNRFTDAYREYGEIKKENPDSLVLYQVGDFFEAYGADAQTVSEALELNLTSRFIGSNQRTQMCGFPANRLETYINMLLDRGFDVAVSATENGERNTRNIVSSNKEDPVQSQPVGRIEHLDSDGNIIHTDEYTSEYQFKKGY